MYDLGSELTLQTLGELGIELIRAYTVDQQGWANAKTWICNVLHMVTCRKHL